MKTSTKSFLSDSNQRTSFTKLYSLNAMLRNVFIKPVSIDATLVQTLQKQYSMDSIIIPQSPLTTKTTSAELCTQTSDSSNLCVDSDVLLELDR